MAAQTETDDNARAVDCARYWVESIREMVGAIAAAEQSGDEEAADSAREAATESVLSVEVRDGWRTPGSDSLGPEEFLILLATGGPAARIVGELGEYNQPERIRVQWQDWFTPWTDLATVEADDEALTAFAAQFYFGD